VTVYNAITANAAAQAVITALAAFDHEIAVTGFSRINASVAALNGRARPPLE